MNKKILGIFPVLFIVLGIALSLNHIKLKAQISPPTKLNIEILSEDINNLPIHNRLFLTGSDIWQYLPKPFDNTFKLVGLRQKDNWKLITVVFNQNESHPEAVDEELTNDSIVTVVILEQNGEILIASQADEKYLSLIDSLPDASFSKDSKRILKEIAIKRKANNFYMNEQNPDRENLQASQQYWGYQLPWSANDNFNTNLSRGWHSPDYCNDNALDFNPTQSANESEIISMTAGTITDLCSVGGQALVYVNTANTSEVFSYLHLNSSSVISSGITEDIYIEQGRKLGTLYNGAINNSCGGSTGTHLHLCFPHRDFVLDGVNFPSTGLPANPKSSQCPPRPIPNSGQTWTINAGNSQSQCKIKGNVTVPGNLIISNNMDVIIDPSSDQGSTYFVPANINIDFLNYHLTVLSGSSLNIKNNSKLY